MVMIFMRAYRQTVELKKIALTRDDALVDSGIRSKQS